MNALFYTLRERYGDNWGSEARSKSGRSLLNDVYKKMRQVGLLRGPDSNGNILILPTAARYSVSYDAAQETKSKAKEPLKATTTALPGWNEAVILSAAKNPHLKDGTTRHADSSRSFSLSAAKDSE